jgi:hypothetical protein
MYCLHAKKTRELALFFLLLAVLSGVGLRAADHPDLTGTWKLDAAKSDFGPFPGPGSMTDHIDQQKSEIIVNRDRAGEPVVIHLPLDGSERTNELRGNAMKTTAHWDGGTLVIDYRGQQRGRPAQSEERWTVAPDGKTMKVIRQLSGPQGKMEQTLLMVRQ